MTPLLSVTDLKGFLPIRSSNTDYDAKLASIINSVTTTFEKACNRSFAKEERIEYHNSRLNSFHEYDFAGGSESGLTSRVREQTLHLRCSPLAATPDVEVYYDPRREFGADTQISEQFLWVDAAKGTILVGYPMRQYQNSLKVVYTAGYGEVGSVDLSSAIPADLKTAAVKQCMHLWTTLSPENVSITEDDTDGGDGAKFSVQGGLLPDVAFTLASYKIPLMGNG